MPATLRGFTKTNDRTAPMPLALPIETQVGDLIVIACHKHAVLADSRITQIAGGLHDHVYVGTATTLDDFALSLDGHSSGGTFQTICATYAPARAGTHTETAGSDTSALVPAVAAGATIATLTFNTAFEVSSSAAFPATYVNDVFGDGGVANIRIAHWNDGGVSPSGSMALSLDGSSNPPGWRVCVIPLDVVNRAPACRKYPRGDRQQAGGGRLYPPADTRQGGRLSGPY